MPVLPSGWLFFVWQQAISLHSVSLANRSAYFGLPPSARSIAQPVAILVDLVCQEQGKSGNIKPKPVKGINSWKEISGVRVSN